MDKNLHESPLLNRLPQFLYGTVIMDENIELLQKMIQFDTQNPPGNEMPLAIFLEKYFLKEKCPHLSTKIIESAPNRGNLIIKIQGTFPEKNPTWGFAAHLDVVPINEKLWNHPPFSGKRKREEHDEFIWGRGTFDMKHIGSSYITAILTLIREGWKPKGNIVLIFESDEERGGEEGMKYLVDNHWEEIKMDVLITEGGGFQLPIGHDFVLQRGEKGKCQTKIIATGVSGHGATPDPFNKLAIYKLNHILNKINSKKRKLIMRQEYKDTVNAISLPKIAKFLLKRKLLIKPLAKLATKILGSDFNKVLIPLLQDTMVPTIIKLGNKENVISPEGELTLDIRILPEKTQKDIWNMIKKIIGKKQVKELEFEIVNDFVPATISPIDTPFYDLIKETLKEIYPKSNLVPILGVAGTDMRYTRPKGVPSYGFSLIIKDEDLSFNDMLTLSHSPNERVSVRNLMLGTEYAYRLMKKI